MRLRNLRLPRHLGLAEDLSGRLERHAPVEEDGADDDGVRAHYFLVVVCVRCVHNVSTVQSVMVRGGCGGEGRGEWFQGVGMCGYRMGGVGR